MIQDRVQNDSLLLSSELAYPGDITAPTGTWFSRIPLTSGLIDDGEVDMLSTEDNRPQGWNLECTSDKIAQVPGT